jgi:four helix bundle protein
VKKLQIAYCILKNAALTAASCRSIIAAMNPEELKKRFRAFALMCIRLAGLFPRTTAGEVIGRQLIKSGTSSAANYRAACVGRSRADFVAKLGIVHEELDESVFWVELAPDANLVRPDIVAPILSEGNQLLAIVVASINTAKHNR